jgi:predicted small metal-binding protein
MSKILECSKVNPLGGCDYVMSGNTEEELLQNAAQHAKQHGISQLTPDLLQRVKANIHEER